MITHYERIWSYIKPDFVHILSGGWSESARGRSWSRHSNAKATTAVRERHPVEAAEQDEDPRKRSRRPHDADGVAVETPLIAGANVKHSDDGDSDTTEDTLMATDMPQISEIRQTTSTASAIRRQLLVQERARASTATSSTRSPR